MLTARLRQTRTHPFLFRTYASAAPLTRETAGARPSLAPLAQAAAEDVSSKWRGTHALGGKTKNYIGGEFVESQTDRWLEVRDPVISGDHSREMGHPADDTYQASQTVVNYVPETTESEFKAAVDAASQAFKTWSTTSIMRRQRVMFE
jgi:malonate-semialdehyde dehydrogenase (acetylating)/methylmalonate-semialdehyde dehydrogenase